MQEALAYIRGIIHAKPRIAVVLGSGLGAFADELISPTANPYSDIPGWPESTAVATPESWCSEAWKGFRWP
jgi:purine-nucleoside phosphorylase